MSNGDWRAYLLSAVAGLALFLSFPKADQGHMAWFALVPLALVLERQKNAKSGFLAAFLASSIAYFALLLWMPQVIVRYGHIPAFAAWSLYILVVGSQALFFALSSATAKIISIRLGKPTAWILPWTWTAFEYLRAYVPFGGLPWLQIGYSQTGVTVWMQAADLTGVYGVSFLIFWVNASIAHILSSSSRSRARWTPALVGLALLSAAWSYGSMSLRWWGNPSPSRRAALLQQYIDFNEETSVQASKLQEGYARMADRLRELPVDLYILPESPSIQVFQDDPIYRRSMQDLARRSRLGLVFNNVAHFRDDGQTRYFNSAFALNAPGDLTGRYDKVHLVPFGEYVPMKRFFFFAESMTQDVSEFFPGSNIHTIPVGDKSTGVIICFEAIFPHLVRELARQGAELLVNLTNDAWYGDSAAPHQHLAMARWRAVENRRFLLRAANSGISAIISPAGEILSQTGLLREEICTGQFEFLSNKSLYTRCGDAFAILCAIISAGLYAFSLGARRVISARREGITEEKDA